jgi:hypothetical protein
MWSNYASDHSDKFVYAKFIWMQITLLGNPFQNTIFATTLNYCEDIYNILIYCRYYAMPSVLH